MLEQPNPIQQVFFLLAKVATCDLIMFFAAVEVTQMTFFAFKEKFPYMDN